MKTCFEEGCGNRYYARGLCKPHWDQLMRNERIRPLDDNAAELERAKDLIAALLANSICRATRQAAADFINEK